MRLLTYETANGWRAAIQAGEAVVDAATAASKAGLLSDRDDATPWNSTRAILALGPPVWAQLQSAVERVAASDEGAGIQPLDSVRLGPPVPDPDKIICLGLNYSEHAAEANLSLPPAPILFAKFRNALVGTDAEILLPAVSSEVDFEAELAVVIGSECKSVAEDRAWEHVAGAMPFNDVSARDLQLQTSQWTAGKAIDTFAPCGPALVLSDEFGDLHSLRIVSRVNGETMQDDTTANMIFSIPRVVSFISQVMTLVPGDIIATGTPSGVGFKREPPVFLRDGDVVEVEVEGLGTLRNPVASDKQPSSR